MDNRHFLTCDIPTIALFIILTIINLLIIIIYYYRCGKQANKARDARWAGDIRLHNVAQPAHGVLSTCRRLYHDLLQDCLNP